MEKRLTREVIAHMVDVVASSRLRNRGGTQAEIPPFNLHVSIHVKGPYDHAIWTPETVGLQVVWNEQPLEYWKFAVTKAPSKLPLHRAYRKMCVAVRALSALTVMLPATNMPNLKIFPHSDHAFSNSPVSQIALFSFEPVVCGEYSISTSVHYLKNLPKVVAPMSGLGRLLQNTPDVKDSNCPPEPPVWNTLESFEDEQVQETVTRATSHPRDIPGASASKSRQKKTILSLPTQFRRMTKPLNPFKAFKAGNSIDEHVCTFAIDESLELLRPSCETILVPQSLPVKLVKLPSGSVFKSPSNTSLSSLTSSISSSLHMSTKSPPTEFSPLSYFPVFNASSLSSMRYASQNKSVLVAKPFGLKSTMPWFVPEDQVDSIADAFVQKMNRLSHRLSSEECTFQGPVDFSDLKLFKKLIATMKESPEKIFANPKSRFLSKCQTGDLKKRIFSLPV